MRWYELLDEKLQAYLPDLSVTAEEPLSRHTSFRIGGPARRMAFPQNAEQLVLLLSFAREYGARPFVLGNGTNVLFPDGGVDRLIVNTCDMAEIAPAGGGRIKAYSGASLARVANFACRQGLTGLEFAHGIPGSVGGGVCMNAGAYGGELCQVIESVGVLFPDEGVKAVPSAAIRRRMDDLMARRKASQPLEYPSAGSTFKRPEGHFAGRLIEEAGCKGLSIGGAQVSEKHAGFVINTGGATCADVLALMEEVQRRVKAASGVTLEPEVRVVR